mgnify:CR=1 FL=1|jgi:uncharacterized protein YbbK (DUF523 family)
MPAPAADSPANPARPPRVAISACLLGEAVRYDGAHKLEAELVEILAPHVEWMPVCPEVELGLGVPREKIRLVQLSGVEKLVGESSGRDHSQPMRDLSRQRAADFRQQEVSGVILKSRSPSCGIGDVKIWQGDQFQRQADGLFAATLQHELQWLPIASESQLREPAARQHFLVQVFARCRLLAMLSSADRADWRQGMQQERMLLEIHSPGCFVEIMQALDDACRAEDIQQRCAVKLAVPASWESHRQRLVDLCGQLDTPAAVLLAEAIASGDAETTGWVHWAQQVGQIAKQRKSGLARQSYLRPLPIEPELVTTR